MSTSEYAIVVTKPEPVLDVNFISTNAANTEADHPAWAVGTTYGLADRVIVASGNTHLIYQSAIAGNVGNDPTLPANITKWSKVSPTNRWKVFDSSNSTQTLAATGVLSYTLRPNKAITTVGILNVTGATSIRVRLVDPTYGTVYDSTTDMGGTITMADWWAWFFETRSFRTQLTLVGLPSYPSADLIIDFVGGTDLAVGVILYGQEVRYGLGVKYGARVGIDDYSRQEENEFGDLVFNVRAFAKRISLDMYLLKEEVDSFQDFLSTIRATPCLWVITKEYSATVLFGPYKTFEILLNYPGHADCSLELRGLT